MSYRKNQNIKFSILIPFTATLILFISSAAWASPDVHVTDIRTPTSLIAYQQTTIAADVANYGGAGDYSFSMYIDGSLVVTGHFYISESSSAMILVTVSELPAGYHVITFCANTCLSKGWTWSSGSGGGTPDLELTDIYPPTSLNALEQTTITARISNIGSGDAGWHYIAVLIDGSFAGGLQAYSLPAGWSGDVSATFTGRFPAGTHSVKFVADYYNAVSESNEGNNEMTKSWTWTGTPDLEVSDIYDPTSLISLEQTTIKAKISNIGNADAGPYYNIAVFVDGSLAGIWQGVYLSWRSYREFLVTFNGWFPAGTHSVKFVVDYNNTISESNEGNNEMTKSWTWTGTSDLELNDIYDPTSLNTGIDTYIGAKIANIGNGGTGLFTVRIFLDGSDIPTDRCWINGLPANSYTECWIIFYGGLQPGTHSLRFVADYYNNVDESNEGNNEMTKSWTWTGSPDLEVSDIYNPTSLVAGEDTIITGRVTNIGSGNAGPFSAGMYIDWEYAGSGYFSEGLPAGYYGEISATIPGGLPAGQHEIIFVADFFDFEVTEPNEIDNNWRIEYFTWTDLSSCAPNVGSGTGVLNDSKSHIDTCYDDTSGVYYYLKDVSRRVNQTQHSHNGQMAANAAIDTKYYNKGLMNDTDNKWDAAGQKSGVDAHVYAGQVYDYFLSKFGLNSFDNNGSGMRSIVESMHPICPDNAFWDGGQVNYCVGSQYLPFSGAPDVVAHEWAHALTEKVGANLNYNKESGALNEAFSDWIGTAIEHSYGEYNWTIGEGIDIARDLSNPSAYGQPDTYGGTNWFPLTGCIPVCDWQNPNYNDCCGVHTNSGVPNKMFYLLSQGGTHNKVSVTGIGIEKAIQIAYKANTEKDPVTKEPLYWKPDATFVRACEGMRDAAKVQYGAGS
ncbi:MAG: M4 family metallopeptidase [Deltaproteobacteria bacterium]|nr:M4 family metallopeptidase [Deltaproteobacteria bacterium]